jgi:hypothetical protein
VRDRHSLTRFVSFPYSKLFFVCGRGQFLAVLMVQLVFFLKKEKEGNEMIGKDFDELSTKPKWST